MIVTCTDTWLDRAWANWRQEHFHLHPSADEQERALQLSRLRLAVELLTEAQAGVERDLVRREAKAAGPASGRGRLEPDYVMHAD